MAKRKKAAGRPSNPGRPRSSVAGQLPAEAGFDDAFYAQEAAQGRRVQNNAARPAVGNNAGNIEGGKKKPAKGKRGRPPGGQAATPARQPAPKPPPGHGKSLSRVPPASAFNDVKRLPPPNLPQREVRGAGQEVFEEERETRNGSPARKKTKTGAGARTKQEPEKVREDATPKRKKPKRRPSPAKRRRNRRIAAVLAIIVLIGAGVWFSLNVLFKVNGFVVEGESIYGEEEIITAFGGEPGDTMFGFSAGGKAEEMEKLLPYIESVTIRRRLPGTVVFKVEPAQESYYFAYEGQYAVLSAGRKVLRLSPDAPEGLTRIDGLEQVMALPGHMLTELDGGVPGAGSAADYSSAAGNGDVSGVSGAQSKADSGGSGADLGSEAAAPEGGGEDGTGNTSLENLYFLLDALDASELAGITHIDVSDEIGLQFGWQGRITVILGTRSGMDRKLAAVKLLLTDPQKSGITEGDRGTIDASSYLTTLDLRFIAE